MAWVPGGTFTMGSEEFYREEAPRRRVSLDGFWIDTHPVTVAEFGRFVTATGHVTEAERAGRTCARAVTACVTAPPRASRRAWTPPPATSASAASCARTHPGRAETTVGPQS